MIMQGSVAVVTGGASGLGRVIAETLLQKGAQVVVLDIDQEALDGLKHDLPEVMVYACDLTQESEIAESVSAIMADFSKIDILVNNAGILYSEPLFSLMAKERRHSIEAWKKVLDINLTALFMMSSYTVEQMILQRNSGVIINISSISAKGNEGQSAYSAAKAGVESLTKVWAKELGRYGIRSVAVAPGFMDTESMHKVLNPRIVEEVKEEILLKKLGSPHDVANTVVMIIENDFVNNTVIEVDGGMCI